MGLPYFTSEEIHDKKELIAKHMGKESWICRRERESKWFSNYLNTHYGKDARIVELGSANGNFLAQLYQHNFRNLSACDIDNYLDEGPLQTYFNRIDLNQNGLPFDDQSVDSVCAFQIIEHLENPFMIAREVARILKPGGTFFMSVPNGHTIWDKWKFLTEGNLKGYRLTNNHISFLTRDVFRKTFLHDFTLKETFYEHGWIPFLYPRRWNRRLPPHRWWSLDLCHVLIKK